MTEGVGSDELNVMAEFDFKTPFIATVLYYDSDEDVKPIIEKKKNSNDMSKKVENNVFEIFEDISKASNKSNDKNQAPTTKRKQSSEEKYNKKPTPWHHPQTTIVVCEKGSDKTSNVDKTCLFRSGSHNRELDINLNSTLVQNSMQQYNDENMSVHFVQPSSNTNLQSYTNPQSYKNPPSNPNLSGYMQEFQAFSMKLEDFNRQLPFHQTKPMKRQANAKPKIDHHNPTSQDNTLRPSPWRCETSIPQNVSDSPNVKSLQPSFANIKDGTCHACNKLTKQICLGCYKPYYCSNQCQINHFLHCK